MKVHKTHLEFVTMWGSVFIVPFNTLCLLRNSEGNYYAWNAGTCIGRLTEEEYNKCVYALDNRVEQGEQI